MTYWVGRMTQHLPTGTQGFVPVRRGIEGYVEAWVFAGDLRRQTQGIYIVGDEDVPLEDPKRKDVVDG